MQEKETANTEAKLSEKEVLALNYSCTRFLSGHYRQPAKPQQALADLAALTGPDLLPDMYGQGEILESFEREVAELLGKEAAVFMPSGTMCQAIALRIWADRRGTRNVAFHPTCHLELHEAKAYQMLHNLHGVLVGAPDQLMTLADLKRVHEPLAALLVELPQREIGGQLPEWEALVEQVNWAREHEIALHLDGARLWECQPYYQRSYAEIAALFDTVYVSFYKILGGIAGAMLAGPADVIAEARVWQHRQGGRLIRLYPFVLSARQGMAERLGKIGAYYRKAQEIAEILRQFPQITLVPDPPQTNMFHLYLRGDRERLEAAALRIAREKSTWLFYPLRPSILPNHYKIELTIGDAALDLSNEEISGIFEQLFEWAEG
jgi:threonine aldolase